MDLDDSAGVARLRESAAQAVDPCVTSAMVVAAFWEDTGGEPIDAQAGYEAISDQVKAVRGGVLSGAEATLVGQAVALNAIFAEMARRGQAALGRPGIAAERYLRLAMRAQAQCRMTLRELANLASRPTKIAEQEAPIRVIQRIIVRPRHDDAERGGGMREVADADDWTARNNAREVYGEGWTAERRADYARMMKARKAWVHSTGPRTDEGKARSRWNAKGNGCRQRLDAELAGVEALMREWEVWRMGCEGGMSDAPSSLQIVSIAQEIGSW